MNRKKDGEKKDGELSPLEKWEGTMRIFKTRFPFIAFLAIGVTCIFITAKMFGFLDWGWIAVFGVLIAFAIGTQIFDGFKVWYTLKMAKKCTEGGGKTSMKDFGDLRDRDNGTFPYAKLFMGVLILLMIGGKAFGLIDLSWFYVCLPMLLYLLHIIIWSIIIGIVAIAMAAILLLSGSFGSVK